MSFLGIFSQVVAPITRLIDDLHTSDEEKLELRNALAKANLDYQSEIEETERSLAEARSRAATAEASSEGWLTRSWRPITMLTFLVLIVLDSFEVLPNRLAPEFLDLLKIGIMGYAVGRSGEKMVAGLRK